MPSPGSLFPSSCPRPSPSPSSVSSSSSSENSSSNAGLTHNAAGSFVQSNVNDLLCMTAYDQSLLETMALSRSSTMRTPGKFKSTA
eukprot:scaffold774_cov248-Pinguiococcus_pyrenoidosus.AAC.10